MSIVLPRVLLIPDDRDDAASVMSRASRGAVVGPAAVAPARPAQPLAPAVISLTPWGLGGRSPESPPTSPPASPPTPTTAAATTPEGAGWDVGGTPDPAVLERVAALEERIAAAAGTVSLIEMAAPPVAPGIWLSRAVGPSFSLGEPAAAAAAAAAAPSQTVSPQSRKRLRQLKRAVTRERERGGAPAAASPLRRPPPPSEHAPSVPQHVYWGPGRSALPREERVGSLRPASREDVPGVELPAARARRRRAAAVASRELARASLDVDGHDSRLTMSSTLSAAVRRCEARAVRAGSSPHPSLWARSQRRAAPITTADLLASRARRLDALGAPWWPRRGSPGDDAASDSGGGVSSMCAGALPRARSHASTLRGIGSADRELAALATDAGAQELAFGVSLFSPKLRASAGFARFFGGRVTLSEPRAATVEPTAAAAAAAGDQPEGSGAEPAPGGPPLGPAEAAAAADGAAAQLVASLEQPPGERSWEAVHVIERALSALDVFSGAAHLGAKRMMALAQTVEHWVVPAGGVVYEEGAPSRGFCMVLSGAVTVDIRAVGTVAVLGAGSCFGEFDLMLVRAAARATGGERLSLHGPRARTHRRRCGGAPSPRWRPRRCLSCTGRTLTRRCWTWSSLALAASCASSPRSPHSRRGRKA